jgi:hypothetical protein
LFVDYQVLEQFISVKKRSQVSGHAAGVNDPGSVSRAPVGVRGKSGMPE